MLEMVNMYERPQVKNYLYNYSVVIRDRDNDNVIDEWEAELVVQSSKKNSYEDFWKIASNMRNEYLKKNRNHSYTIEATVSKDIDEEE